MNITKLLAQMLIPIDNPAITGFVGKTETDAPALMGKFLAGLIGFLLVIATLLTLGQLFQGGLEWITSGGDKTNLENARNRITNTLIGLVLVFAAWGLYVIILRFLGISLVGDSGMIQIKLPTLTQ